MRLKIIQEINRKKIHERERMHKFATKFMDEGISKDEVRSTGFFRSDLLYWRLYLQSLIFYLYLIYLKIESTIVFAFLLKEIQFLC